MAAHPIHGRVCGIFRTSTRPLPQPWDELFGPLRAGTADDLVVVGQIGQSLDGRIATATGHSHYINGPAGLAHLHRLRALVDAVVIGVGTALADDPQLTVRRVAGPEPARVVIDPNGRLAGQRQGARQRRRPPPGGHGGRHAMRRCRPASKLSALPDDRRADRAAGDPRRAGRARLAPHPDRRRRRHGVALPRRRLPRPAACDGRADHPRRRAAELHLAADRARRSRRCACRCARISSTTRCCSTATCRLSACRSAARRIDVTDAD